MSDTAATSCKPEHVLCVCVAVEDATTGHIYEEKVKGIPMLQSCFLKAAASIACCVAMLNDDSYFRGHMS